MILAKELKRLIWIEATDHFFAGGLDELEEQVRSAAETPIPNP